ncbi:16S rRNA (adenine(1518)-N(6)/adenine(1519)-N(6))-dimethyltransferase RsmA [Intestinimonas butyriciproducens]|uniref:Ribosomal RNA small subunit methyltransferase A n=1 Tax=Intestinimonas butyriciproducens TaxID=1297617 RepID=A0A2U1CEI2_9FIRM|nr:16S rRNA (adenine(1518)-N(6)/adenine(1519)-N(6))-dimethyltransferase RsmA [Intestinimonas butyriciproducens]MBU5229254.1 16S rRNA (adenine(1518)-N(6)/adenine(1519)-N(6))-dimethyltransferase RsmA [Intestinimonas butyriciproducens]MCR1905488.1 16S rRNA (adenine(1518)-N(6)/adenine(1519)-N(6))-dimethyltransferase RsmA [Intestinimonas butyriciproducens]PVY59316.1 16S rRNA (adenine1518-N6/adenine1519-N6)-dimethyltransferase [Intestinimonas butyriciproducens]QBB66100.1 SSU rRNA (adenine(1518)-N(6)/
MDLCDLNTIRLLLGRHGFRFSRSMGQNFLIEGWVPDGLVEGAGVSLQNGVLEIGPGIGPLTMRLSNAATKVVAVELDRSLLPVLAETLAGRNNVEIIPGDILKLDIGALVDEKFSGLTPMACANLPYNITTPVLSALIDSRRFAQIAVMIQREVALRICAAPGTAEYGAFSIYCQYHTAPELLFDVGRECFVPAPKVTSSVVRMTPRHMPPITVQDEKRFFRLVKAAFGQRRKTLLNALTAGLDGVERDSIRAAILSCGLPEDIRGERLGIPEFAALTAALGNF